MKLFNESYLGGGKLAISGSVLEVDGKGIVEVVTPSVIDVLKRFGWIEIRSVSVDKVVVDKPVKRAYKRVGVKIQEKVEVVSEKRVEPVLNIEMKDPDTMETDRIVPKFARSEK